MTENKLTLAIYPNALADFHIQLTQRAHRAEKLHCHDYYQIYFVSHGTLTHYYADESETMGKGDAFIIPPNQNHRIATSDDAIFYTISFFLTFIGKDERHTTELRFLHRLDPDDPNPFHVRPKVTLEPANRQIFEDFCHFMLDEFESHRYTDLSILHSLLIVLIALFSRSYNSLPAQYTPRYDESRKTVLRYIENLKTSFTRQLTLKHAVQETLMNKSMFCAIFLETAGMTFRQYLNKLRIQYATELILTTNNPFTDIAELSGYKDFSTFYRNFLHFTGVSPSKYRKLGLTLYEKH